MEHNIEMEVVGDHKTLGKKGATIVVHHPLQAKELEEKGVAKFADAADKKAATKAAEANEKTQGTPGVTSTNAIKDAK